MNERNGSCLLIDTFACSNQFTFWASLVALIRQGGFDSIRVCSQRTVEYQMDEDLLNVMLPAS